MTHFLNLALSPISGMGESTHFKYDTESGSRDPLYAHHSHSEKRIMRLTLSWRWLVVGWLSRSWIMT